MIIPKISAPFSPPIYALLTLILPPNTSAYRTIHNPLMKSVRKRFLGVHISRTTAIGSAIAVANLIENVSEVANFGPTKGAAKTIRLILETILVCFQLL